jgi:hypothetical protein
MLQKERQVSKYLIKLLSIGYIIHVRLEQITQVVTILKQY